MQISASVTDTAKITTETGASSVYPDTSMDPESPYKKPGVAHAFGYHAGESMVGFFYNTQSNTLPIFWSVHKGWIPLFQVRLLYNLWSLHLSHVQMRTEIRFVQRTCRRLRLLLWLHGTSYLRESYLILLDGKWTTSLDAMYRYLPCCNAPAADTKLQEVINRRLLKSDA